MRTSVIIPTYNGANRIGVLLKALKHQTSQPDEIIIVVDGSTDNTIEKIQEQHSTITKVIEIPNTGRARARNTGATASSGTLLIFYDDDMEPSPESISSHIEFHRVNPGILTGNQEEVYSTSKTDIQNYKAYISDKWISPYSNGLNRLNYSNLFFTAANCSFKKLDFEALGGFNKMLTDAEDYEIALRALRAGLPVYFDKINHAVHHDLITCQRYITRQKEYKHANTVLLELHQEAIRPNKTPILKNIFYALFSFRLFPYLIDSFNIFLLLPRVVRYKLYSVIIHAQSRPK